ncbi:MAG: winged helix-turn-helix domain-containing protein [Candidatus Thorarchaeota archaeon]|nr:winged helix-turn-helix domain-containing protein [Candidatus Thorarchaeota archaeon]
MRYDSRAYLQSVRNIDRGLCSRDSILKQLNNDTWLSVSDISAEIELSYATIRYHLFNLESEGFIERNTEERGWKLRVFPQAILSDFVKLGRSKSRKKKTS